MFTAFLMFVTWPQRKQNRYKHLKFFATSFSAVLITLGAFLMFSSPSNMIIADHSYDVPDSLNTVEEKAEWHITAGLGQVTVENNDVVQNIDYSNNHLAAHLTTEDNVTTDLIRSSTLNRSALVLQRLSQIQDVEEIQLIWDIYFEPETGPGEFDTIFNMRFDQEVLSRVEWSTFNVENLEEISDDYWEEPRLTEEDD